MGNVTGEVLAKALGDPRDRDCPTSRPEVGMKDIGPDILPQKLRDTTEDGNQQTRGVGCGQECSCDSMIESPDCVAFPARATDAERVVHYNCNNSVGAETHRNIIIFLGI
jgi:hypothetical protein